MLSQEKVFTQIMKKILIHLKYFGILKYSMPEYIKNFLKIQNLMKLINEIKDADIEDGGSGSKKKRIYQQ